MTGAIDMGANSISNLQTPTLDLQAANKSYVDTAVAVSSRRRRHWSYTSRIR